MLIHRQSTSRKLSHKNKLNVKEKNGHFTDRVPLALAFFGYKKVQKNKLLHL
jgi:hypothetical protein